MATVVITFFLFVQFCVYKMDADYSESQRDQFLSRREKRWSMNSQRLEEIVAELMRPISSDVRRSFDTDLSALLEEYLTEAGLHALDSGEDAAPPNFSELALVVQQSANIYGRKVDCLYQNVLSVSDSLLNTSSASHDASGAGPGPGAAPGDEPLTPSAGRGRRRRASAAHADFALIELEPHAGATREPEAPRPPPTLPRYYIELEPRVLADSDVPLLDYAGEPIGLLADFQVAWRLHDGLLVDELEGAARGEARVPPALSLLELQAAIAAAAPASPPRPPHDDSPPRDLVPLHASTPLPPAEPEPAMPPPARKARKRRSDVRIEHVHDGTVKLVIGEELMEKLKTMKEFHLDHAFINAIVKKRKKIILSERRRLLRETPSSDEEFAGFTSTEALAAMQAELALASVRAVRGEDSEDDGFFEQSSAGSSGSESTRDPAAALALALAAGDACGAWQERVLRQAAAAEARGALDVRALGGALLEALRGSERRPRAFADVLRAHAAHDTDVSRILLTTLFLANAGNVEIVSGAPLSLDSFSLRLLSSDTRRYSAAAAADEHFLR
ncbi:uncharacterized protein LOC142976243 isoform X2 [Anticarsia gemmatalis]|uniref:uncharacterized protein LOC142976243 isoform X2 n=1 Tax=Anticarsia gemmatalis TaxID=129554 RepID=UPI003F762A8A